MVTLIAAMDKNRVIGNKGTIPWKLKADLVRLSALTSDQVVIVGRKTYESMSLAYGKRPMPARLYVVVTRDLLYTPSFYNPTIVVNSIEEALETAQLLAEDTFILGGSQIYSQTIALADRMHITEVEAAVEGDAWFPEFNTEDWNVMLAANYPKDKQNEYDCSFITYERK